MTNTLSTHRWHISDALAFMGEQGWDSAVNLRGVLVSTLGEHATYAVSDIYDLCGLD
jgi:hypothetical protein